MDAIRYQRIGRLSRNNCKSRELRFLHILLVWLLSTLLLSACDRFEEAPELSDGSLRLTAGNFKEVQVRFHPKKRKLLALRYLPQKGKDARDPAQQFEQSIIEVDFHDPTDIEVNLIGALEGGSYPSYTEDDEVVALDMKGNLVLWRKGSRAAQSVQIKNLPSKPAKPVASPDGKKIAFLAIPNVKDLRTSGQQEKAINLNQFRYQGYVLDVKSREALQISRPMGLRALVTGLDWADDEALLVHYQIVDPRDQFTRIERFQWPGGERILALFCDIPSGLSIERRYRFFVMPSREGGTASTPRPGVRFVSRGMDLEETIDLEEDVHAVVLSPDGRYAVASRYCPEDRGINLFLVPTPEKFRKLRDIE